MRKLREYLLKSNVFYVDKYVTKFISQDIYENDDVSKQLREKSETVAIMDDVSDENEESAKDTNNVVYNGSTVLSFHSNT